MTPPRRRTASLACFPFAWNLPHRCQTRWPAFSIRSSIFYGKDRRTTSNSSTNSLARFLTLSNPLNLDRWFRAQPSSRKAAPCRSNLISTLFAPWTTRSTRRLAAATASCLMKGARQMGKTSLLSRALEQARGSGFRVAVTDFQKLNTAHLASPRELFTALGSMIALQLDLDVFPPDVWREHLGPNDNFERYLRREVLAKSPAPLVWAMDEVDRLFTCPFASEVFGLFRSWHNARALEPSGPWRNLIFTCRKPAMMSAAITSCGPASIPKSAQCSVAIQAFIE